MNTTRTSRLPLTILRLAALAALPAAPAALAQTTIIESSTTINLARQNITGVNTLREYQIYDDALLTLQSTGPQASGGGGAFNLNADGVTLVIGPSGPGAGGWALITNYLTQAAGGNGAAIHVNAATASAILTNVTFDNNSSANNGGGIRSIGVVTLNNVYFNNNNAAANNGAGGGVYNERAMTMNAGAFTGNYALTAGGALHNTGAIATASLTAVLLASNRAGTNGGAVLQANGASLVLTDVVFQDNWAAGSGGAFYDGSTLTDTPSATLRLTGTSGITDYHYTGNFAGGGALAATPDALQTGAANFAADAAAGGFYYQDYQGAAATMTFDIAAGVSLTIGDAAATSRALDSIASADDTAAIAKSGAGLMVLNADNSHYSGAFAVNAGTLLLGNAQASLGGAITVAPGATFGGAGTVATGGAFAHVTAVTVGNGATLQVGADGAASAQTLAIDGLADFQGGAIASFDLFSGNASSFLSVATGTLNWAGTGTINLGFLASGSFTLAQWGAGNLAGASSLSLTVAGAALDAARGSGVLSVDSQKLILVSTFRSLSGTWAGPAGGVWKAGGPGWDTSTSDVFFQNGDRATFLSGGSLSVSGGVTASEINVSGAASLVIAGGGSITTDAASVLPGSTAVTGATGSLVKTGAGSLTLANTGSNNFKDGVRLEGGVIAFATAAQLGLDGGAGATATFVNSATLAALAGASGSIRGDLVLDAASTSASFDTAAGAAVTLDGVLRGAAGAFTKTGAGSLTLLGDSGAFAGATQVNAGSLLLGGAGASLGGNITAASGGVIGGAGALTGSVTLSSGGALQAGLASPGALNLAVNNLQLGAGSMLNFQLLSGSPNPSASVNSFLTATTLGFTGAGVTGADIIINLSDVYDGSFDIATFATFDAAALAGFPAAHVKLNDRELTSRESVIPVVSGNTLSLSINKGNQRVFWTGATGAVWTAGDNWRNVINPLPFADGDIAVFDGGDTAGIRDIFIEGAQIRVSGMEVTGSGDYRFSGGALVVDAASASGIEGTGVLLVDTTGALTLANDFPNVFTQGVRLAAGTIVPESDDALGDNPLNVTGAGTLLLAATSPLDRHLHSAITIENDGVLTINTTGSASTQVWGPVTSPGNGSLVKTGTAMLVFAQTTGTNILNVSTFTIEEGPVTFQAGSTLIARDTIQVRPAGAIYAAGGTLKTATLVNQGTIIVGRAASTTAPFGALTIDGNYLGDGGTIIISATGSRTNPPWDLATTLTTDQLIITGTLQGSLCVTISGSVAPFSQEDYDWSHQPVIAAAIDPDATIDPRSSMLRDQYWYYVGALTINPDGTITYQKIVAPEIPPVIAIDAASLLIGKASLDSLSSRLSAIRLEGATGKSFNAWIAGLARNDRLSTGIHDGATSKTRGAQAGIDWGASAGKNCLALGAFFDYAKTDMDCPQPSGKTRAGAKAAGYGLYAGLKRGAFYADAIARQSGEDYDITTPGSGTFGTSGKSSAASLGAGYAISGLAKWTLEPQARLAWQSHKIDNVTDPVGRRYDINRAESLEALAALRVSQSLEWRAGLLLAPYARAGLTREFKGKTKITVANEPFENSLADTGGLIEAGAVMQLGKGAYALVSVAWQKTRKLESHSLDATLGLRW